MRQCFHHPFRQRGGHRRAAEIAVPPSLEAIRGKAGVADHRIDLGGNQEGCRDTLLFHKPHEFFRIPARHQHLRVAVENAGLEPDQEAGDVEQRGRAAKHVVVFQLELAPRAHRPDRPRFVARHDALRESGRAAGEIDQTWIARSDRNLRQVVGGAGKEVVETFGAPGHRAADNDDALQPRGAFAQAGNLSNEALIDEQRFDVRIRNDPADLAVRDPCRQMGQHGAGTCSPEMDRGIFRPVGRQDRDVAAFAVAGLEQRVADTVGGAVERREALPEPAYPDRGLLGDARR